MLNANDVARAIPGKLFFCVHEFGACANEISAEINNAVNK
jgi:hypothetical protein